MQEGATLNQFELTLRCEELERITTKKDFKTFEDLVMAEFKSIASYPEQVAYRSFNDVEIAHKLATSYLDVTTSQPTNKFIHYYNCMSAVVLQEDVNSYVSAAHTYTRGRDTLLHATVYNYNCPAFLQQIILKAMNNE